jgi:hypothetical protein
VHIWNKYITHNKIIFYKTIFTKDCKSCERFNKTTEFMKLIIDNKIYKTYDL